MTTVTAEDQAQALELVQDLKTKVSDVIQHVEAQVKKVECGECNTAKGVSFLEVKYQTLLSYLINLTQLLCVKVSGHPIKDNPAIGRLVELRTVLEKMRPIDKKLKYQLDKLLKTATTGTLGEKDPLRFKPNPDNLQNKLSDDSEEGSDEEKGDSTKLYRPPKLAAMSYDGDESLDEKKAKMLKRAQKRAMSSNIMRDLRHEYSEGPEEIQESMDLHRRKEDNRSKERQEYEEKYFMRMSVSKKERNEAKKLRTITGLNDIAHFGDISALTGEGSFEGGHSGKKRRKSTTGKKNSKAAKKWKRKK